MLFEKYKLRERGGKSSLLIDFAREGECQCQCIKGQTGHGSADMARNHYLSAGLAQTKANLDTKLMNPLNRSIDVSVLNQGRSKLMIRTNVHLQFQSKVWAKTYFVSWRIILSSVNPEG